MERIARRWAAIRHPELRTIERSVLFTFAADHGVAAEGVSRYPQHVTAEMVYNFLRGGAAINCLCRHFGIRNVVVDVGVNHEFGPISGLMARKVAPATDNLLHRDAMTLSQARQAVSVGVELTLQEARKGADLIGCGEMGIGNTTAAAALFCALLQVDPKEIVGRGTGIDDTVLERKTRVVRSAVERIGSEQTDPWQALAAVGGFEIAAMAGVMLAGAYARLPVVVDGYICSASAAFAMAICPAVADYLFFSHRSRERGHQVVLDRLGACPLLDLDLRLGEGTGAALGMNLVAVSVRLLLEMATFEDAGVSGTL